MGQGFERGVHCSFVLIFNGELAMGFILIPESIHNVASIILVNVGKAYPYSGWAFSKLLTDGKESPPPHFLKSVTHVLQ